MVKPKIRTKPTTHYWWGDNELVDAYGPKIGATALAVYCVLARFAGTKGVCFPPISTIARQVHLSDNTVKKALKTLETAGLITVQRRPRKKGSPVHQTNLYSLIAIKGFEATAERRTPDEAEFDRGVGQEMTPKKKDSQEETAGRHVRATGRTGTLSNPDDGGQRAFTERVAMRTTPDDGGQRAFTEQVAMRTTPDDEDRGSARIVAKRTRPDDGDGSRGLSRNVAMGMKPDDNGPAPDLSQNTVTTSVTPVVESRARGAIPTRTAAAVQNVPPRSHAVEEESAYVGQLVTGPSEAATAVLEEFSALKRQPPSDPVRRARFDKLQGAAAKTTNLAKRRVLKGKADRLKELPSL